jgi:hypothetical protein
MGVSCRAVLAYVSLLAGVLALPGEVTWGAGSWRAQPGENETEGAPDALRRDRASSGRVIVVRVPPEAGDGRADRAFEALRVHLASGEVDVVFERSGPMSPGLHESLRWAEEAARSHGALGVFWLDLESDEDLVLSVADPDGKKVLTRRVPRDPESPAAAFEALGIIARTTVLAVLAGEEIGMRPVASSGPVEPPVPEARSFARLMIAAEYLGTNFADPMPWQHGVGLNVSGRPLEGLVLGLGYGFFVPDEVERERATLIVQRNPIEVRGGFHADLGRSVAVELLAQAFVDPIRARTTGVEPPLAPVDDSVRVLVSAGGSSCWTWFPRRPVGFHLCAGVEALMSGFDYVVTDDEGRDVLLSPHAVRARVAGGMSYRFLWRARRAR